MLRYLLDTDTCIHMMKNRYPALRQRFIRLQPGEAAISIITYGELRFGLHRTQRLEETLAALQKFLVSVPALSLPLEAASHYAAMRAHLEKTGRIIGTNDLWIAAHALSVPLILVTNNEREFRRVPGLEIENWTK